VRFRKQFIHSLLRCFAVLIDGEQAVLPSATGFNTMPPRLRLFMAIDPPGETSTHVRRIIEQLRRSGIEAGWVDPSQLHLTLHFLGSVNESELHAICPLMDQACEGLSPFEVEYGGVGAFPGPENPRTIWLGVRRGGEELVRLHDALGHLLEPLGYPLERRRFLPHITVGRVRREKQGSDSTVAGALAVELEKLVDVAAGGGEIAEVSLFSSHLDRNGPAYELLHTADLLGR